MIRIGILGYGYWGPNLSRNFNQLSDAQLACICDRDEKRLKKAQALYPHCKCTTDYAAMLADPDIDAVVVATPVATHFPFAMEALKKGKHVLVEKPLTHSVESAHQLVDYAREQGLTLMVDHTFVYTGAVRKIKELIDNGELGEIYYYDSVRVNLGLFQHDVSVIWDLAVHDLSILDYILTPKITRVSCTGVSHVPGEPVNIAYLTLTNEHNFIAHIHANWLAPVKIRQTLISGSKKMIVYDDLEASEKIKVYDKGIAINGVSTLEHQDFISYRRTGDVHIPYVDVAEALLLVARQFVSCIQSGERPITDGQAGLRLVQYLEAGSQSKRNHGAPVIINGSLS